MPDEQRLLELSRRAAELVAAHALDELTVEEDGCRVTVRRTVHAPAPPAVAAMLPSHVLPPSAQPAYSQTVETPPLPSASALSPSETASLVALTSPMVGVFYHSPTPDDPPFVRVGDTIKVGQTVGLIEAMKVYSELPSDVSGRVVRLAAENGTLVQQGQPLLYVEAA